MKFIYNILLIAFFAVFVLAATASQKPVVVSYPKGTPDHIVEEAMEAVRKAGGVISHEYHLIKGFAAKLSDETIDVIHSLGEGKHTPTIEDDKVISIAKDE